MFDERRERPRINAPFEIAVIDDTGKLCGRLANFNTDGLMLISAAKWQEGQMYSVILKPENAVLERLGGVVEPLPVNIECLWVDVCGGMSWVGAQFTVFDPVQIVALACWVKGLTQWVEREG